MKSVLYGGWGVTYETSISLSPSIQGNAIRSYTEREKKTFRNVALGISRLHATTVKDGVTPDSIDISIISDIFKKYQDINYAWLALIELICL